MFHHESSECVGSSVSYVVCLIIWPMIAKDVCHGTLVQNYVQHKWRIRVFFYTDECIDPRVAKEKASTVVISVVTGAVNPKQIELSS